jgi:colanic acid biosynthesis glycosyl transferase WcaI
LLPIGVGDDLVNLLVLTPHFAPDVAPTATLFTRIVEELAARGHRIEVVTTLPWYREHRIEPGFDGKWTRHEDTPWGRIIRVHPFPVSDKRNIPRRALSYAGSSALAAAAGARGADVDAVLAISPPLTNGLSGWLIARSRKAPLVFNVQDVFPDVAVELGALKNRFLIGAARRAERFCYAISDAVTVLSEDLKGNLVAKGVPPPKVHVIPNFVDVQGVRPLPKENPYRNDFALVGKTVVMYAGNVGLSQPLDIVLDAAAALAYDDDLVFVINGQGAQRSPLEARARGMANVVFIDMQPQERLGEVLAAADLHLVPLKRGLGAASLPSKVYSILAAGRPFVASVDEGTEIARLAGSSGAGIAVPPEDAEALTKAIRRVVEDPDEAERMGKAGRNFVEGLIHPSAVAEAYEALFKNITGFRS